MSVQDGRTPIQTPPACRSKPMQLRTSVQYGYAERPDHVCMFPQELFHGRLGLSVRPSRTDICTSPGIAWVSVWDGYQRCETELLRRDCNQNQIRSWSRVRKFALLPHPSRMDTHRSRLRETIKIVAYSCFGSFIKP